MPPASRRRGRTARARLALRDAVAGPRAGHGLDALRAAGADEADGTGNLSADGAARPAAPPSRHGSRPGGSAGSGRTFTIRLMVCIGVAAVVSDVLPLQRSYWVVLTVAIVLKPDYGSVPRPRSAARHRHDRRRRARRGHPGGGPVRAVAADPDGGAGGGVSFGRSRNFGLVATFLTPLVVLLIDLLAPGGWRLALDRLIDTMLGCAIVLLIGYAPWPMSWYAHLPRKFAEITLVHLPLHGGGARHGIGLRPRGSARREPETDRGHSDGAADGGRGAGDWSRRGRPAGRGSGTRPRAPWPTWAREYQRTMSEPPAVSRRSSAWWPHGRRASRRWSTR